MSDIHSLIDSFNINVVHVRKKNNLSEKNTRYEEIHNLCEALKHRVEMLNLIYGALQDFKWDNDIADQEELHQQTSNILHTKDFEIMSNVSKSKKVIKNIMQLFLMDFFSLSISIFGIVTELLWRTFEVKDDRGKIINDKKNIGSILIITERITQSKDISGNIKQVLRNYFGNNNNLWFIILRDIRNDCEHGDHTQIFLPSYRIPSLTHPEEMTETKIPFIHERYFVQLKNHYIDSRRVDKYCNEIQKVTFEFLGELFRVLNDK